MMELPSSWLQVLCQPVYGGVNATVDKILVKLGLEVTYINGNSLEEYKKAIKPNTKVSNYIRVVVQNIVLLKGRDEAVENWL